MKDSWDSRDSCSKFNIQHSTFNIIENGFTKLHQAGVSPALFSGFRPGRGKSPSDEMDSKMHPALRAVAEEWIQQEHQGVQSPASILYFLPFGRTLIFISDNRWISVSIGEHRWASVSWENEMLYLCIVIQKEKSHTDLTDLTDLLRCTQWYSLYLTVKKLRRSKNPWDPWDPCGKTRPPWGEKFVRFERFVFKNQALRSAHLTFNT